MILKSTYSGDWMFMIPRSPYIGMDKKKSENNECRNIVVWDSSFLSFSIMYLVFRPVIGKFNAFKPENFYALGSLNP